MKNSHVIINGLTRLQANSLAILCEMGVIGEAINSHLERIKPKEDHADNMNLFEPIEDTMAEMDFDDADGDVKHSATFDV